MQKAAEFQFGARVISSKCQHSYHSSTNNSIPSQELEWRSRQDPKFSSETHPSKLKLEKKGSEFSYPTPSILEFIKSPGIIDSGFLANSPPKLRKINDIPADSALVADYPCQEPNHGERPDDLASEARDRVRVLHVCADIERPIARVRCRASPGGSRERSLDR